MYTFRTLFCSVLQMVWTHDKENHSNTGYFRPIFVWFSSHHSTTGHVWTVLIQDLMVTVLNKSAGPGPSKSGPYKNRPIKSSGFQSILKSKVDLGPIL